MSISVSSADTWANCPRQYWYRYVARAVPASEPPAYRRRGIALHAGIEAAYRLAAREVFRGVRMMDDFADEAVAAFDKSWPEATEAERADGVDRLITLLESLPRPRPERILGIEQKFTVEIDGVRATGVMDIVLDCGGRWIHIRDWKSGAVADAAHSAQLSLYVKAARKLYPHAQRITAGLFSLKTGIEDIAEIDPIEVEHNLDVLTWRAAEIEQARRNVGRGIRPATAFPATPSERCSGCVFRAYCPQWGASAPVAPGMTAEDVASTRDSLLERLNCPH